MLVYKVCWEIHEFSVFYCFYKLWPLQWEKSSQCKMQHVEIKSKYIKRRVTWQRPFEKILNSSDISYIYNLYSQRADLCIHVQVSVPRKHRFVKATSVTVDLRYLPYSEITSIYKTQVYLLFFGLITTPDSWETYHRCSGEWLYHMGNSC